MKTSAPFRTFSSTGELENPLNTMIAPKMMMLKGNKIAPRLKVAGINLVPMKITIIPAIINESPFNKLRFRVFCSEIIFLLARWEGRMKNASKSENPRQAITTKAISRIISNPSTKSKTEKAIIVVSTDVKTEGKTSIVPSIAACGAVFPFSK